MSQLARSDIVLELLELVSELLHAAKQQLAYYRASVYKHESVNLIGSQIGRLKLVVGLFNDDGMLEPFRDYEAMPLDGAIKFVPGSCGFSERVTALICDLEELVHEAIKNLHAKGVGGQGADDLASNIQRQRSELLAMCSYGSRQWSFFQSL